MRYLCLLYVEEERFAPGAPEFAEAAAANMAANKGMAEAGVLVDSAPLHPVRSATTMRIREDETLLTDGPYAELKEQLGGYYLLECADLDEALRWARTIPAARYGSVEPPSQRRPACWRCCCWSTRAAPRASTRPGSWCCSRTRTAACGTGRRSTRARRGPRRLPARARPPAAGR